MHSCAWNLTQNIYYDVRNFSVDTSFLEKGKLPVTSVISNNLLNKLFYFLWLFTNLVHSCEFSIHYFGSNIDDLSQPHRIRDMWTCSVCCFLFVWSVKRRDGSNTDRRKQIFVDQRTNCKRRQPTTNYTIIL